MKKIFAIIIFAATLLFTVSAFSQDVDKLEYPKLNKLEIPEVDKVTLDNGITIYILEDKSLPVFNASVRMAGGSYLEPLDKVGLASICGQVMRTGGTTKWSGDEIDEKLEAVGGSVETYIGLSSGGASVNILSEYTDLGLEVLADVIRNPKFEEDKIDLAKVQARSNISRRNDDPQQIAIREFRKVIYGADSPYARITEYATINAISRDDLVDFHNQWFHPQNMQIAVWGDIDKKEIVEKIKTYFGDWERAGDPVPAMPDVDYKFDNQVYYINKPDVNQTNIILGHIGGKVTDPDYGDRIVMNNILGGSFGSRLFNSVRSREGLAYAVSGSYTANIKYPGIFYCFSSTKSETTIKAIREIIKEIKRMQTDAPTPDEMRLGKDGYLNSFVFNFDNTAEVVNRLMNYDFNGLPEDHLFKVKEDVEKVSPEDVIKAAQDNLRPDALRIIVVGKGEDFEIPIDQAGLGNVTEVDITIPSGEEKKELAVNEENLAKGKALIDNAVIAHGGADAIASVKSIVSKGTFVMVTPQGEFPLQFESIYVIPDKSREVISVMGQTMITVRNGSAGWKPGMAGMAEMTEDDIIQSDKDNAKKLITILQNADSDDYKFVYDGAGNVNGTDIEYVSVLDKADESLCCLGIDKKGMIVVREYWGQGPNGEGNIQEIHSGFNVYNGVLFSTNTLNNLNGDKMGESKVSEILINSDIPPGSFDKPE